MGLCRDKVQVCPLCSSILSPYDHPHRTWDDCYRYLMVRGGPTRSPGTSQKGARSGILDPNGNERGPKMHIALYIIGGAALLYGAYTIYQEHKHGR